MWFNHLSSSLLDQEKIILPPIHIKLGHAKNVVKEIEKYAYEFFYLKEIFLASREAKLNAGVQYWTTDTNNFTR